MPVGGVGVNRTAWLSGLVTIIFWSSAFVGIRVGLRAYSPYHLVLLRFLVASLCFILAIPFVKIRVPPRRSWWRIAASGVAGFTIYHTALTVGEVRVNPGAASFIIAGAPIFSAVLAALFLKERQSIWGWAGIVVSLMGVVVITGLHGMNGYALLIVLAAVSTAAYFILEKPLLKEFRAIDVTAWVTWAGALPFLVFAPGFIPQLLNAPAYPTGAIIYTGIFPAAVAYVTWSVALSHADTSRVAPLLYLNPLLASALGWLLLGEVPRWTMAVGGLFILVGVVMVQRGGRAKSSVVEPQIVEM